MIRIAFLLILLLAPPAYGQVRVIDGDSLKLNGTAYRLHGIDAPELWQTCAGWPAGALSRSALEMMTDAREIRCETRTKDKYGRSVAICWADGRDIGAAMVRLGMAWAYRKYSQDYVKDEDYARANARGVHAQGCQVPWEYRAEVKK